MLRLIKRLRDKQRSGRRRIARKMTTPPPKFVKTVETLIVLQRTKKRFQEIVEANKVVRDGSVQSVHIQSPMKIVLKEWPVATYSFVYSEVVQDAAVNYRYDRGVPSSADAVSLQNAKPICRNFIRRCMKENQKEKVQRGVSQPSSVHSHRS